MVRYLIFIFVIAFYMSSPAIAQPRSDENFNHELSYGINLNSNGGLIGGVFVRSSYFKSDRLYQFWAVELVEVKHPKEQTDYGKTGESFIIGKQNYLFVLRPQYGMEKILFRKAPESGVQVNAVGAIGPSIGLLVPYYVRYSTGLGIEDIREIHYNPDVVRQDQVLASSGVFRGLPETAFNLGVHVKSGLSFEYGRYHENITGVEVGFMLEYFMKPPIIIPEASNPHLFSSVYLHIYYGRRK